VLRRDVAIPAFDFTEVPATVRSGTSLVVAWSEPESAVTFDLELFSADAWFLSAHGRNLSPYRVTPIDHVGEARLTVAARSGSWADVYVTVVRTTTMTFEAAP
jgi:hypothetical protein